MVSEQAGKLNFGSVKSITSFYDDSVFLHISHVPLIITLIGDKDANVGMMMYSTDQLKAALDPVKTAVEANLEIS
jgi:hypothetical protein